MTSRKELFCVLFISFVNEKVASGLKIVEMETEIYMMLIIYMVLKKEANFDNTHCLKWEERFACHPRIKFFYCHPRSSYKKGCRLKKKSCREWVGGVLQVTGQKYVSKYVSYIERWFRIERDGLTVTWIMLPDQKCLSRNRFSKDLVNNMPLYTTAVNCVPACLNRTIIYNKKSVGQF